MRKTLAAGWGAARYGNEQRHRPGPCAAAEIPVAGIRPRRYACAGFEVGWRIAPAGFRWRTARTGGVPGYGVPAVAPGRFRQG